MPTVNHLNATRESRMVDFDPDSADLELVDLGQPQGGGNSCLPLLPYRRFRAGVFRSVGTGDIDTFQIIAATAAAGTGATVVETHALGDAVDAVGDTIWLETDVENIRNALATATHVGVRVEQATSGDECIVFFERADPLITPATATADYISS